MPYTEKFKDDMVRRLMGPSAVSAKQLAKKVGVGQPTLSKWKRDALTLAAMSKPPETKTDSPLKSPGARTAEEKLRLVGAAHGLTGEALGAFLRREGIHEAQLEQWRKAAEEALSEGGPGKRARTGAAEAKRMRALEKELRRKDRALAETAALLVLKKKMEAYWEDEDASTDEENEK